MTTVQQANAALKVAKAKPVEATAAWYAPANAIIAAAKGALGTQLTADQARGGELIGGPAGKPKRGYAERLYLALVLRAEGCSPGDFQTIKGGHGKAENCLYHAQSVPSPRLGPVYGWVDLTRADNGVRIARLTPKGAAYLAANGVSKAAVATMSKPYAPAKPAKVAKADKPATDKAKADKAKAKPAPKADKPAAKPVEVKPVSPPKPVPAPAPKPVDTKPVEVAKA